jgi:hypothetical protein
VELSDDVEVQKRRIECKSTYSERLKHQELEATAWLIAS